MPKQSAKQSARQSAGLLLYRLPEGRRPELATEVFLVHPGGPFWKNKDDRAWSIPKGEFADGEDPLEAAKREFEEETGSPLKPRSIPHGGGPFRLLRPIRQPGGKIVHAWAVQADVDEQAIVSNTFRVEWPPRSGKAMEFPEIDRAAWFPIDLARRKILKGQLPLLDQLVAVLAPLD